MDSDDWRIAALILMLLGVGVGTVAWIWLRWDDWPDDDRDARA